MANSNPHLYVRVWQEPFFSLEEKKPSGKKRINLFVFGCGRCCISKLMTPSIPHCCSGLAGYIASRQYISSIAVGSEPTDLEGLHWTKSIDPSVSSLHSDPEGLEPPTFWFPHENLCSFPKTFFLMKFFPHYCFFALKKFLRSQTLYPLSYGPINIINTSHKFIFTSQTLYRQAKPGESFADRQIESIELEDPSILSILIIDFYLRAIEDHTSLLLSNQLYIIPLSIFLRCFLCSLG